MYCSKCGNEIKDTDQFCPKCGGSNKDVSNMNEHQQSIIGQSYQTNQNINNQGGNEKIAPMALGAFICSIVGLFILPMVLRNNIFNFRDNFKKSS